MGRRMLVPLLCVALSLLPAPAAPSEEENLPAFYSNPAKDGPIMEDASLLNMPASNYAELPGGHCLYTFTAFGSPDAGRDGDKGLWNTCYDTEQQCQRMWRGYSEMNNGRAPATGAYVPAHNSRSDPEKPYDPSIPANTPAPTIVACANEFGCLHVATHTSANSTLAGRLARMYDGDGNTASGWTYNVPYDGRPYQKSLGATMEQSAPAATEDAQANPVHPRALRKAVCKCNMGFTSPLQLESSWCGAECPGPDCALTSAATERTEAWCDDVDLATADSTNGMPCPGQDSTGHAGSDQTCPSDSACPTLTRDRQRTGGASNLPAYMESRYGDVHPGPYVPEFAHDLRGAPAAVFNSRINVPLSTHGKRKRPGTHNGFTEVKQEPAKAVRRGAYDYYTPSTRYAESGKYDSLARNLFNTLAAPVLETASGSGSSSLFVHLTAQERHARRVRLKRFACRYVLYAFRGRDGLICVLPWLLYC